MKKSSSKAQSRQKSFSPPPASGTCGENLTWVLENGVLTISGEGAMENYSYEEPAPWYSKRLDISSVVVEQGVTSIGSSAFSECSSLTSIVIPSSVTNIGNYAFSDCSSLTSITIPDSVTSIGDCAFLACSSLTSVTIPNSVTSIGAWAFYECSSLTNVTIPNSVTSISDGAFSGCYSLTDVYYLGSKEDWENISIGDSNWNLLNATLHCAGELKITLIAQPQNVAINEGNTAKFTVAAEGTGLSYQWQYKTVKSGAAWTNCSATTAGYNTSTINVKAEEKRNGYQYRCIVTDAMGRPVISDAAALTVKSALKITTQPKNFAGAIGDTVTLSVAAEGTGLTYTWYYSKDGGKTYGRLADKWSKAEITFELTEGRVGFIYYCVVKDADGNSVKSDKATLSVKPPLSITTQPKDFAGAIGDTVTLSVAAEGTGLTYTWYYSKDGGKTFGRLADKWSKAAITFELTAGRVGFIYYCVVKDADGNSVKSNKATLSINASLSITSQPANATAAVGDKANFKVVASGTGLTYQWQFKSAKSTTWANSSGKTVGYNTDTLTVEATEARNGYSYRCIITDANGNSVTTNAAVLTVK